MAVIHVTGQSFQQEVMQAEKAVILDFWAPWCGPCRMVGPILEEIAEERDDVVVAKVNVDEELDLARQYGISSIPTIMVFKNGEVTAKAVGYRPKEEILTML